MRRVPPHGKGEMAMTGESGSVTDDVANRERFEEVRSAFIRSVKTYGDLGSPLYAVLFAQAAEDPEIVALACAAQPGANPAIHLLACVHYLVLGEHDDPLARFYATIEANPAPPEQAYPHFARFCRVHRAEIERLLATRTVQSTYVERCGFILPLLSQIAEVAGEPLNLIEVGCSAAVLLTFDKYSYRLPDGRVLGSAEAPLTIDYVVNGGPLLHLPAIGRRIGIDLAPIHADEPDERRWLIAVSLPELAAQRADLLTALDTVATTDIDLRQGDALALIGPALADTPDPVCVFHSACLSYWSAEAQHSFDAELCRASAGRTIYRAGIEASSSFYAWHSGQSGAVQKPGRAAGAGSSEFTLTRYRDGRIESAVVAQGPFFGPFQWLRDPPWT